MNYLLSGWRWLLGAWHEREEGTNKFAELLHSRAADELARAQAARPPAADGGESARDGYATEP